MLANQSDFMAYAGAFKSNYRKGVHRLETILSNPTMSAEFAANLGGVSVVLGVPISMPDRNSDKLLELLLGSAVADNAVETWLHQFYEFTDWDDLLSDSARCKEMANNPLIWRAAGGSKLAVGKSIATLAGLSCSAYKDIDAVVASSTAMTAIVAAPVAMAAMWRSDTAIKALQANATAWKTFTGASSAVMGKTVAILANLNPSGYADMTAVAASSTAMAAVAASSTAMAAIQKSQTALNAIAASSMATAKYAAGAAGLNPADYADMKAVAASSTAMAAVAASSTAMTAVAASSTAMAAVAASSTAMAAIIANSTALNAVVTSSTAMAAVGNSITAMSAISASSTALTALCNSPLAVTTNASTWGSSGTLLTGKRILVGFSQKQYSDGNYLSTLGSKTDGSGSGDFTITLNAANYNKYQPMAVVVNPLVWRSNDWGGNFTSSYINGVKTIPIS